MLRAQISAAKAAVALAALSITESRLMKRAGASAERLASELILHRG